MKFAKEADLCAAFIAGLPKSWTAYPETAGFDILLAHKSGPQVGIEAKLQFNVKVVEQAMEFSGWWRTSDVGPDFRAVLIPSYVNSKISSLCPYLGITAIPFDPILGAQIKLPHDRFVRERLWHDLCPATRSALPEYVPDVVAGSPAPISLTRWKIGAIKLQILMEKTGFLCRADFKEIGVSISRWMPNQTGWLALTDQRGKYARGEFFPDFRAQHPKNFEEIERDFDKWRPTRPDKYVDQAELFVSEGAA